MTDKEIEYVQTVINCGSITKAAEILFITPSALSKYIKGIEQEYGVQLFHRIGKRLEATYAAERYLSYVKQIQFLEREMLDELHDIASLNSGKIRFGVMSSCADLVAKYVLPKFYKEYPNIQGLLDESTPYDLRARLRKGELDFAIIYDNEMPDTFHYQFMPEGYCVLIVPADHPLLSHAVKKPEYPYPWIDARLFAEESFILPTQKGTEILGIPRFEKQFGYMPKCICRMKNIRTIALAVSNSVGVSITNDQYLLPYYDEQLNIAILNIDFDLNGCRYFIASRKGQYVSKAMSTLMNLCYEVYSGLQESKIGRT